MGFWKKLGTAVAAVALGAVAVAAIVVAAPAVLTVAAAVAIGVGIAAVAAVTTVAVVEIIKTDDIDQYLSDSADTFFNGNWTENQTALGRLGRMTLNILQPWTLVATSGQDFVHNISHWENTPGHYLQTAGNVLGLFGGVSNLPWPKNTNFTPGGMVTTPEGLQQFMAPSIAVEWGTVGALSMETSQAVAAVNAVASTATGGGGSGSNGGGEKENPQDKTTNKNGDGASEGAGKQVQHNGKTVTQNNSLFDPNAVDEMGRTNVQRMQQGLAPKGYDGKPVNIHHIDQTNNGPVMEVSGSSHTQNYSDLHTNTGQSPSQIDRSAFNKWRTDYWKWRANDFTQP